MILLFVVNRNEFFLSHRLPIAIAARDEGYDVHVVTGSDDSHTINSFGLVHHFLPISRSGLNPWLELKTFLFLWSLIRNLKPDLLHLVTIKPVIYGGLIARLNRVPSLVIAISGLGSIFVSNSQMRIARWIRLGIEFIFKVVLRHPNLKVIFQNNNDKETINSLRTLDSTQSVLISGSGILLEDYPFRPEPNGIPVITFASRLLKEKGVNEFVEASRILKNRGINLRFWLLGLPDYGNPSSVQKFDVDLWQKAGFIEYFGFRADISNIFASSNIIVLPSYYGEGLPKVLIEAAACGRAVVTTDSPGCREAILPNESGLLVPIKDAISLADAIEYLIVNQDLRQVIGKAGRHLAEKKFRIENVVELHLKIYSELMKRIKS